MKNSPIKNITSNNFNSQTRKIGKISRIINTVNLKELNMKRKEKEKETVNNIINNWNSNSTLKNNLSLHKPSFSVTTSKAGLQNFINNVNESKMRETSNQIRSNNTSINKITFNSTKNIEESAYKSKSTNKKILEAPKKEYNSINSNTNNLISNSNNNTDSLINTKNKNDVKIIQKHQSIQNFIHEGHIKLNNNSGYNTINPNEKDPNDTNDYSNNNNNHKRSSSLMENKYPDNLKQKINIGNNNNKTLYGSNNIKIGKISNIIKNGQTGVNFFQSALKKQSGRPEINFTENSEISRVTESNGSKIKKADQSNEKAVNSIYSGKVLNNKIIESKFRSISKFKESIDKGLQLPEASTNRINKIFVKNNDKLYNFTPVLDKTSSKFQENFPKTHREREKDKEENSESMKLIKNYNDVVNGTSVGFYRAPNYDTISQKSIVTKYQIDAMNKNYQANEYYSNDNTYANKDTVVGVSSNSKDTKFFKADEINKLPNDKISSSVSKTEKKPIILHRSNLSTITSNQKINIQEMLNKNSSNIINLNVNSKLNLNINKNIAALTKKNLSFSKIDNEFTNPTHTETNVVNNNNTNVGNSSSNTNLYNQFNEPKLSNIGLKYKNKLSGEIIKLKDKENKETKENNSSKVTLKLPDTNNNNNNNSNYNTNNNETKRKDTNCSKPPLPVHIIVDYGEKELRARKDKDKENDNKQNNSFYRAENNDKSSNVNLISQSPESTWIKICNKETNYREETYDNLFNKTLDSNCSKIKENIFNVSSQKLSNYIQTYFQKYNDYPKTDMNFYQVGRFIGKGAFGKVNLGLHVLTGRLVALKSFNKKKVDLEKLKRKMHYETSILKSLNHINVVKIYETFDTDKFYFISMEYISCGDLLSYVRKRSKLTEDVAKFIFKQVIKGLIYIHGKGFAHRDIKLDNILIDINSNVKICDFGVAKKIKKNELMTDQCGTPAYIAPEVFRGSGYNGAISDIWSAGVLLYAMLAGTVPFKASKLSELQKIIMKGNYNKIKGISPEADDLLSKILDLDPYQRITEKDILDHIWLDFDEVEFRKNTDLFTSSEKIYLANSNLDFRTAKQEEIFEAFTYSNLDTIIKTENSKTKSIILAPFNSSLNEDNIESFNNTNNNSNSCKDIKAKLGQKEIASLDLSSLIKNNFFSELPVLNFAVKFDAKVKAVNKIYELNNNGEIDNGIIISPKCLSKSNSYNSEEENKKKYGSKINSKRGSLVSSPAPELDRFASIENKSSLNSVRYYYDNFLSKTFLFIFIFYLYFLFDYVLDENVITQLSQIGYQRSYIIKRLSNNEIDYCTASYYLLIRDYIY